MSTKDHPDTKVTGPTTKERKFTQTLKCPMTDKEMIETGDQLAAALQHYSAIEAELKEVKADYAHKLKSSEAEIERLRNQVSNKFVMRPVDCSEVKDFAKKEFRVTRLDTNEEIEKRALRMDELQTDFIKDSEKKPTEEAKPAEPMKPKRSKKK